MFWRLRVLTFYALLAIFTITFFLICYIPVTFFNINYYIRYRIGFIFSYVFIWLARIFCGLKYQVFGLDKLPASPSIVLSNHQSCWEQIFVQLIIPEHSWVLKKELFNIPLFGWGLEMVKPIAVDRNANISVGQILREGQEKIKSGLWLVIFPESTRFKPEQNAKFKPSAVKLASLAKVPIVMMAHNAGVYWPKGFWIEKPGVIQVKIIDVIPVEEIEQSDVRQLTEKIEQVINNEKQILFEQTYKNKQ
ncbi:MAG: 1-acyl-sn-glycerol-3-phosphate acyltransferase [Rickettsia endosymbiont of Pseudomimeciton antennatum]|nr:1-acyl-sn-glycerol-3-phosphate acyltransferase [Rickettsia endosymbiont of Pseudomimeciton antennatum]MCC8398940.1 1-acyl-sn-glycerol-3-phosphate acyltransferase [Rickettsia endosymbiont of Labidopullus appendiculatus]